MTVYEIDLLSEEGAKDILRTLIENLDDLDDEDFFGAAGWRQRFGLED